MKEYVTPDNILIAFDLDDTLYKEIDFVRSAFYYISRYLNSKYPVEQKYAYNVLYSAFENKENPFDKLFSILENANITISENITGLVDIYRNHPPAIELDIETYEILSRLKSCGYILALVTDGRSITQRNKITALGLDRFFENHNIIISDEFGSEKTNISNFKYFNDRYPFTKKMFYIGDNPKKDFFNPAKLGWKTICLKDNGTNIHPQDFTNHTNPDFTVNSLSEIYRLIQ